MNTNDTKDILAAFRTRSTEQRAENVRVRNIAMMWENGEEDAFDAPAPRTVMTVLEEDRIESYPKRMAPR
jgi:hypothetical protein